MATANWLELSLALIALFFLGVSSWVELSLSAVSHMSIRELLEERLTGNRNDEVNESNQLRSSMLLIQATCIAIWAALFTYLLVDSEISYGLLIGVIVAILVVLFVGRIVPSLIVGDRNDATSSVAQRVGKILSTIFKPLLWPVNVLSRSQRQIDRDDDFEPDSTGAGELAVAELDGEQPDSENGDIEADEHFMLTGVLQLEEGVAHDVMVPRIDLVALPKNAKVAEAVAVAIGAGHSRIPLYGDSVDDISGILYVKDLLKYVTEDHEDVDLEDVAHPSYFVPETKPLDDLLHELQQTKIHMAVVVDEYGGTAGVVTIEDILEEIVGEIEDEFDKKPIQFDVINEAEIVVDGRFMIDDVTDHFDLHFEERPAGTVSGLIQRELGHIPDIGESIEVYRLRLTVLDADRQRIRSVQCEYLGDASPVPGSAEESLSPAKQ